MFYYGWNADYPDPENFLFLLNGAQAKVSKGGENASNYSNPEYRPPVRADEEHGQRPARGRRSSTSMQEILRRDSPWLWGYHPKDYVLQHSWLHNVKSNIMANNKFKYWRVDSAQRDRLRREWNPPVIWPLWLGAAAFILFGVWMWRVLWKREEQR